MQTASITKARKMIAAIDRRIDAVREELLRNCPPADEMSAHAWQRAWDSYPGLQGIERSLYARRGHWQTIRNEAQYMARRAAERREQRKYKAAPLHQCEHCGSYYRAA